jgi:hypothetical protein
LIALLSRTVRILLVLLVRFLSTALLLARLLLVIPIVTTAALLLIRLRIILLMLLVLWITVWILLVHDALSPGRRPANLKNAPDRVSFPQFRGTKSWRNFADLKSQNSKKRERILVELSRRVREWNGICC